MLTDVRYAIKQLRGINCQQYYLEIADRRDRALDALERIEESITSTSSSLKLEDWIERVKGEGQVSPCGHFVIDDFGNVTIVDLSFPVERLKNVQEALGGRSPCKSI